MLAGFAALDPCCALNAQLIAAMGGRMSPTGLQTPDSPPDSERLGGSLVPGDVGENGTHGDRW